MTTIAYDGRYIAVDSQVTSGELKGVMNKLFDIETADGLRCVVAGCGSLLDVHAAVAAIQCGKKLPKGDYALLSWTAGEGVCELYGRKSYPCTGSDPVALGSGAQAALGAMKAGTSAIEAVRIAGTIDLYTSGPVVWFDTRSKKTGTKGRPPSKGY